MAVQRRPLRPGNAPTAAREHDAAEQAASGDFF